MKPLVVLLLGLIGCAPWIMAAQPTTNPSPILATIPMPGVKGDFDHFAYDEGTQRLFLAASDKGSVEVLDLTKMRDIRSIGGFKNPHSIVLNKKHNTMLVTDSAPGASELLHLDSLQPMRKLPLAPGANCVLLSPDETKIFITAGGDRVKQSASVLESVNAVTMQKLKSTRVPALHLQPMAFDEGRRRLLVNLADQDSIGIFSSDTLERTATWRIPKGHKNSPIVFDQPHDAVFVIASDPGILMALDPATGALRAWIPTPANPDDLGFDPSKERLFVPGETELEIYQIGPHHSLQPIGGHATGPGARTGIFLPDRHAYAVAIPADSKHPARVVLYEER